LMETELKFIRDFSIWEETWIDWMDIYTLLLRKGRIAFCERSFETCSGVGTVPLVSCRGRTGRMLFPKPSTTTAGDFVLHHGVRMVSSLSSHHTRRRND
jgi:hypothetical protein